jgi:hypothetical protein
MAPPRHPYFGKTEWRLSSALVLGQLIGGRACFLEVKTGLETYDESTLVSSPYICLASELFILGLKLATSRQLAVHSTGYYCVIIAPNCCSECLDITANFFYFAILMLMLFNNIHTTSVE